MVDMKCEGCVNSVKNKLQTIEGVKNVEVDLSNQVVRILGIPPVKTMTEALEQTERKARLLGQGVPEVSAAVAEFKGPEIFGVARLAQVNMELARIEASFSGLPPGKHSWSINEYGDLTKGPESTGKVFNPTTDLTNTKRLVKDFHKILNQVSADEIPESLKLPTSFNQLVSEMKIKKYSAKDFALILKGMMERSQREIRESKLTLLMNKHFAASAVPKGIHCLSLRLTDEYSSNAHARRQLPSPELLPLLSDNSFYHFVLSTDNILAASVVVTSTISSFLKPKKYFSPSSPTKKITQVCTLGLREILSYRLLLKRKVFINLIG